MHHFCDFLASKNFRNGTRQCQEGGGGGRQRLCRVGVATQHKTDLITL